MKTLKRYPVPASARLFRSITHDDAENILSSLGAVTVSFEKDEMILDQWAPATHHYLVVSGEVHSFYYHVSGKRSVTDVFRPGDDFGLTFAWSKQREIPSMAIATRDSVVIRIPIIEIVDNPLLVSTRHGRQYIQNVVDILSQTVFMARLRAFVLEQSSIESRIMTYLVERSKHTGSTEFDIPFDRQEFADFLNCGRPTLCTALGRMRCKGLINFRKNHFRIKTAV